MTPLRILVIGSGGREHALAWRLARDAEVSEVLVAPGNDGMGRTFRRLPVDATDGKALVAAAESERVTLAVIELDPDSVVPEHHHENEQVGVLVSGLLEFRIGDETRRVEPGGTWCIPAHVPHEVRTESEGAVAVEVFAPARSDWAALERLEPRAPRWPAAG